MKNYFVNNPKWLFVPKLYRNEVINLKLTVLNKNKKLSY
jgi:hypothetical protein